MLPTTTQVVDSKISSAKFYDRLCISVSAVIIVLLAEVTLTACTCALTQWTLDLVSTDSGRNVHISVYAMYVVGAALIIVDFLLMLRMVVRSLRHGKFQVFSRNTSTAVTTNWNSPSLAGNVR
jgi:hypothetical protein